MAMDQGPVVLSAMLRGELVRLRRERELTQEQVAADLEWSPSKLIRVEGGRSSITKVDLDALLDKYGLMSASQRDRMQALNRGARERAWWDELRSDLNATYLSYVGYEAGASSIRQFQSSVIPGLLQTSAYAQALNAATVEDHVVISSAVRLRLLRQAEMAKRVPTPRQHFVLDEAVIRRHVGVKKDPGIMPDQLRQLVARVQQSDRLAVQVVPFSVGEHAGMTGPFTLLEFEGGLPDLLYLDAGRGVRSMSSGNDATVAEYADAFDALLSDALSVDESLDVMLAAAEEMS